MPALQGTWSTVSAQLKGFHADAKKALSLLQGPASMHLYKLASSPVSEG